jgi:hypothetical protein
MNEYLLSAPPDISTDQLVFHFADGDQEAILAKTEAYRNIQAQISAYNNRVLTPFGYSQQDYQQANDAGYLFWYSDIYHGKERIAHGAYFVKPASVNNAGTDFIVEIEIDGTYVLTRNSFEKRPWPPERELQLYVGDRLLSTELTSDAHQQGVFHIYLDDKLAYQAEMHPVSTYATADGPWSYNGHWAVVLLDAKKDGPNDFQMVSRLIQDGQDLNTTNGYEQSFQFALLNGHPFYFYQKTGKTGISFDGQEISKDYDEVPHYGCCSSALLNPRISMNMVWFFARRGTDWYYVEAYVPFAK